MTTNGLIDLKERFGTSKTLRKELVKPASSPKKVSPRFLPSILFHEIGRKTLPERVW
jgi:hypothetical protein